MLLYMTCLGSKRSRNRPFFNPHDSSVGCQCRVKQKFRKSSLFFHKTKNPFEAKICVKATEQYFPVVQDSDL